MGYDIVQALKRRGKIGLLEKLKAVVELKEKGKGKLHQEFHLSFDAENA